MKETIFYVFLAFSVIFDTHNDKNEWIFNTWSMFSKTCDISSWNKVFITATFCLLENCCIRLITATFEQLPWRYIHVHFSWIIKPTRYIQPESRLDNGVFSNDLSFRVFLNNFCHFRVVLISAILLCYKKFKHRASTLYERNNFLCFSRFLGYIWGTYKVRNEIETKRNETKSTKTKRNETKKYLPKGWWKIIYMVP
jgi:hypothetical protein